jgi:hypothetical protein
MWGARRGLGVAVLCLLLRAYKLSGCACKKDVKKLINEVI